MVWRVAGLAVGWAVALLWATRGGAWLRGMSRLPDLRRETAGPGSRTVERDRAGS